MGSNGRLIGGLAGLGGAVGYEFFNDSEGPLFGASIVTMGFVAG